MPNRIIKESICYSDDLDQLTPFEETVFYRLIVNCDDFGRIDARPSFLRSMLFRTKQGITNKNIEEAVAKLELVGLVQVYLVAEHPFLLFPKWSSHQRIRDSKAKYPAPIEQNDGSRQLAATRGNLPPESNPIRIQSESNPKVGAAAPTGDEKHKRGQFGWVKLTDNEYQRIISDFGEDAALHYIAYVDESAQQTGNKNKWKDWNLTVRKAIKNQWGGDPKQKARSADASYDITELEKLIDRGVY